MSDHHKPVLQLPGGERPRHLFHAELVPLLKAAGCSHFVAEQNGRVLVARGDITLDSRRLAEACDAVAAFHHGNGEAVAIPRAEANILHDSPAVLTELPYRWEQVRRFIRASSPVDRATAEQAFEEYAEWCNSQGERVEIDEQHFATAVRDTWRLLARA